MRRAKWGIGAAAVVGLAWLISNLFNINVGGIGSEDGSQIALPSRSSPSQTAETTEPPPQSEPETESVVAITPESEIGSGGIIEVLIEDRDVFLRRGSTEPAEWVAAEPDAIAGYAKQAPGDETGLRVRIYRKPSARASAEERLIEALANVGVKRSEIDLPERLVK